MDFRFSRDAQSYQEEVRAFFAIEMDPQRTKGQGDHRDLTNLSEDFERALQARAGTHGYLGITVDPAYGGLGKSISHQVVFNFEAARYDAPAIDTAMTLAGHAILAHGTEAQKAAYVPRMLAGEIEMSIAYSEANAGNDLSALEATATAVNDGDGDGFVLRGTKVMVTGAHKADHAVTIVRSNPDVPVRQGMTMFLIDLKAPGVVVRRRAIMNNWTLGEITFDDLRLGPEAVLGQVDQGWTQVISSLEAERSGIFHLGFIAHVLDELVNYAQSATRDGVRLADDPVVRDRIAGLYVELESGLRLAKRTTWLLETGQPNNVAASMSKVFTTELEQRVAQAATEIAGHRGSVYAELFGDDIPDLAAARGRFAWEYLERVHGAISVGSNEVHRDGIAQAGLRLPRAKRK